MSVPKQLLSCRFEYRDDASPSLPVTPAQEQCIEACREHLLSGRYRIVHEPCPCGLAGEDVLLAEVDRYGLPLNSIICLSCGTVRTNPYLDEASLNHFYMHLYQDMYARKNSLPGLFAFQRQHYGQRIWELYCDRLPAHAAVLEVGCGTGGAIGVFHEQGHVTAGCDFSRELIDFGVGQSLPNLWYGSLDQVPAEIASQKYDLIYLHHVFEHVQHPECTLNQLRGCLNPGGRILIVVPDLGGIDSHRNPAGDALKFFHVAHKFNFTIEAFRRMSERAGLVSRTLVPPFRDEAAWEDALHFPELWVELSEQAADAATRLQDQSIGGRERLAYLQETERLFQQSQCAAQLAIEDRRRQEEMTVAISNLTVCRTPPVVRKPSWLNRVSQRLRGI